MLSLVFSTFCSNHQKVIEAKRCVFFTTLPARAANLTLEFTTNCWQLSTRWPLVQCLYFMQCRCHNGYCSLWSVKWVKKAIDWYQNSVSKNSGIYMKGHLMQIPMFAFFWTKFFQLVAIQLWPCCNMDGCWDPFSREIPSSLYSFSMQSHSRGPEIQRMRTRDWRRKNQAWKIPFPISTLRPGSNLEDTWFEAN